jgi:protein transport protein SEC24
MPPRSRYAVDPSLTGQSTQPQWQSQTQSAPQNDPNYVPPLHQVNDRRTPPPVGAYAPAQLPPAQTYQAPSQQTYQSSSSFQPPQNHIPPPPHSSGPSIAGPRTRIDPSQVPNPVEAQELDQNLYDDDDFLSCQPRGLMPMAGTDYRGIDQGRASLELS